MKNCKITLDEWLNIAEAIFRSVSEKLSDDGRISLTEGFSLALEIIRLLNQANKE